MRMNMNPIKAIIVAFKRSCRFSYLSFAFLCRHRRLLLFPLLAYVVWAVLFLTLSAWVRHYVLSINLGIVVALIILAAYFLLCFTFIFFNAASLIYIYQCLANETVSVRASLYLTLKRLPALLGWCLLTTTFGLMMAIFDFFNQKVSERMLDVPWSLYHYLALPMILFEKMGPVDALCRCRTRFSHQFRGIAAINIAFVIILLAALFLLVYHLDYHAKLAIVIANIALFLLIVITVLLIAIYPLLANIIKAIVYMQLVEKKQLSAFPTDLSEQALIKNE